MRDPLGDVDPAEVDDQVVWVGEPRSDNNRVYHSDRECYHVEQIHRPRAVRAAEIADTWRECRTCQARDDDYWLDEAHRSGDLVWIGGRGKPENIYHTDKTCHNLNHIKNARQVPTGSLTDDWRECKSCQADGDIHANRGEQDRSFYEAALEAGQEGEG